MFFFIMACKAWTRKAWTRKAWTHVPEPIPKTHCIYRERTWSPNGFLQCDRPFSLCR